MDAILETLLLSIAFQIFFLEMTLPEDNSQIFASKYETVLPSKEALQKLLQEHITDEDGGEDE